MSDIARLPLEIVIHVTQEAEEETQDGNGDSPASILIGVSSASWLVDKEIMEDRHICNAVVIAEIISHDNDRSQMIVMLNLLSGSVCSWNMALFCPVPQADALHVVRCLFSQSKTEDRCAFNILLRYWTG